LHLQKIVYTTSLVENVDISRFYGKFILFRLNLSLNSDQGSHFTSPKYTELLLEKDIRISMDGKGRALDNIVTERLWRTIKYEEVYLKDYESPREARKEINNFIHFYNYERPHQSLGYKPPASVYGHLVIHP